MVTEMAKIKSGSLILKFVETVLYILTTALLCAYVGTEAITPYIIYLGFTAYLWMVAILLLAVLINRPVHKVLNFLLCLVFAFYGIVGGAMYLTDKEDIIPECLLPGEKRRLDYGYMAALLAIVNAFVYLVDGIMDLIYNVKV